MNFLFLRSWKRAILKMRRLTLPLWCQYLLVLWAFPLLLQDVVFDLIPPTEKDKIQQTQFAFKRCYWHSIVSGSLIVAKIVLGSLHRLYWNVLYAWYIFLGDNGVFLFVDYGPHSFVTPRYVTSSYFYSFQNVRHIYMARWRGYSRGPLCDVTL